MIASFLPHMPTISDLRWVPGLIIALIMMNRYIIGSIVLWYYRKPRQIFRKTSPVIPTHQLTVCVIVPLYNEGASIRQTIQSIQRQDHPAHLLRYVIVDDCSSDDSAAHARAAIGNDPRGELYRNPKNMGKRLSIVNAVKRADAEIIVSVDSDVLLRPNAVSELLSRFKSPEVGAVGGRVGVINANQNWLTQMQTIKYYVGYEFLKGLENAFGSIMCLSGCLTAYRRHVLIEVEPYLLDRRLGSIAIKYGEDRYLTRLIVQHGYRTYLNRRAQCFTKAPDKLLNFFSQQLRWRRSNFVDYIGGFFNVMKFNPIVAIHYFSLACLFIVYPVHIFIGLHSHQMNLTMLMHLAILGILAMQYRFATRDLPREFRVPPASFLFMSFVMPVTYLLLTPLAIFTLDTGSWETRKASK